ncbi:hypothetical protein NQ317_019913 [Molorchus minor]|uniref:C-CAP/cofactor C-like domain-containing protein n=1 Tax=Molorchus minor TaxID=1323400 RepID=A0ABQ9K579_9CUCU|nr:hypothetical protein NQ317_019913 [Molorchus minor]
MIEFIKYSPEGSESIPQEIEEATTRATLDLLPTNPTKSKKQYELAYKRFVEWCDRNSVAGKYSENALRPAHVNHQSLFIKYTSNKYTIQPVGINIFGKMPTDIPRFLKLPNSEFYTGHCCRRTSASLLADSGGNLCTINRYGGWKSSSFAEGYLEDSLENKKRIACHILPNNCLSSNNSEIEHINSISSTASASSSTSTISSCEVASSQGINITNCSNCTIKINISK